MAGFKVGDRVKLTAGTAMSAHSGATAVVTALGPRKSDPSDLKGIIEVKWDRNALSGNQMDGGYFERCFELIPANPLADLNVGDKFTLEFEVVGKSDRWLQTEPVGVPNPTHFFALHKGYQPGNIVRKPVEPAAGQLWTWNAEKRQIVAIAKGYVMFMEGNQRVPKLREISDFKRHSTYVGPAES